MTSIRNPLSFAPLGAFALTSKSSGGAYFFSTGGSTNSLNNTSPSRFASVGYKFSPAQLNASLSLQLTLSFSQAMLLPAYLQISIAPFFIVDTLSCNTYIDFVGSCTVLVNNTLKVSGNFSSAVMGVTVTGFSSPNSLPSANLFTVVNSFDGNANKID